MESRPKMRCYWGQVQNSQICVVLLPLFPPHLHGVLCITTGQRKRVNRLHICQNGQRHTPFHFVPLPSYVVGSSTRQTSGRAQQCGIHDFRCSLQWPVTEVVISCVWTHTWKCRFVLCFCNLARGFHSMLRAIYNPEQLPHGKGMSRH